MEWLKSIGGALIGGFTNLLGGHMAQERQNELYAQQLAQREREMANAERLQKEFAQNSIKWRKQDAIEAGIHPMYALGSPAISPAVSVQGASAPSGAPMASAISAMGQDVSRAAMATKTVDEREAVFQNTVREMTLQRMTLQNDLLASQIGRLKQQGNPPAPSPVEEGDVLSRINRDPKGPKERTRLLADGTEIHTDPGTSDANEFTNRYGEFLGDFIFGPYVAWRDYNQHYMQPRSQLFEERRRGWHGEKFGHGRGGR